MGAINGVPTGKKNSLLHKKKNQAITEYDIAQQGGNDSIVPLIFLVVVATLVVGLAVVLGAWKFCLSDIVYNNFLLEVKSGQTTAYVATRDINAGELLDGCIKQVDIPSNLNVSNKISSGSVGALRASSPIKQNSIITSGNTYNPETQDITLNGSRLISVDYIDADNVEVGDYVDIRFKRHTNGSESSYRDDIVCSKKLVIEKTNNSLVFNLSESDILNLNTAVVESALKKGGAESQIYLAVYVDPANQSKAQVTYTGNGITYTGAELAEAEQLLRSLVTGEGTTYSQPDVVLEQDFNSTDTEDKE